MELLTRTIARIQPLDEAAMAAAGEWQTRLTKPPGSLGVLEQLAVHAAGIAGSAKPFLKDAVILTMAGDHGVVEEGVSAFPQEVTVQMLANFMNGGAAINVLARHVGARVSVVDLGVKADHGLTGVIPARVRPGTDNIAQGPAMTRDEAVAAVEAGIRAVQFEIARGADIIGTGDMGIGNTTPSAAILAALSSLPPETCAGRGTGINHDGLRRKVEAIRRALAVNQPDPRDALDVLSKVGGLEIGGLAGVILGAAAERKICVIDGYISGAAALIAARLAPLSVRYMIASHESAEAGHRYLLELLGLTPVLKLNLRLGEGTGAALAIGMLRAAMKIVHEMATFDSAGISGAID
ncbi:MAG: nicotinate-nucleotide--dimethylbenzimidazole phosphoribosyltransferase [Solirubrobacterales bacterium]